ncbi:MAG: formate dehydrogenase subunit delta [Pseudomonadota bacterium]
MNTQHLIQMANQIGAFFESYPDRMEACGEIANHIQKFWAPRMRIVLLDHLTGDAGGHGLSGIVLEALRTHRARLEPQQRDNAA